MQVFFLFLLWVGRRRWRRRRRRWWVISLALVVEDFKWSNVVFFVDNDSFVRRSAVFFKMNFNMHFFHAKFRRNRHLKAVMFRLRTKELTFNRIYEVFCPASKRTRPSCLFQKSLSSRTLIETAAVSRHAFLQRIMKKKIKIFYFLRRAASTWVLSIDSHFTSILVSVLDLYRN